jgi:hypothetical protein
MSRGNGGTELPQHLVADDEVRERVAHAAAADPARHRLILHHVLLVLGERHWRDADVVALLQEQQRAAAAFVGDAVTEGRPANGGSAEHLDLMRTLQELEYGSDHRVFEPEAPRDLEAAGFGPEVQLLEA